MLISDLTTIHGFEAPKTTSETARRVLKRLKRDGFVYVEVDDGPNYPVVAELAQLLGAIGIPYQCSNGDHNLVAWDDKRYPDMNIS